MMPKEQQWVRGDHDAERLPSEVQDLMNDAVIKMAAIYGLDLKAKPKRKVIVYEHIAMLIDTMPPNEIRHWLETGAKAARTAAKASNDHSEGV